MQRVCALRTDTPLMQTFAACDWIPYMQYNVFCSTVQQYSRPTPHLQYV